ncbi:MAG: glycosyltransferase [Solirubrobacterales bacterium]|jgi:glycosyltransferase involved in cell wall biosynthesis|nr:glycosyltransferase [Solirubrobacterales bacterium]
MSGALLTVAGRPTSSATWSGSSRALLEAARRTGFDLAAADVSSSLADGLETIAALSPDRERWRQRYHANVTACSPLARRLHTLRARGHVRDRVAREQRDAVIQVGHWYDLSGSAPIVASYSDASVALQLRRTDLRFDPDSEAARRASAWEAATARRMDVVLAMSQWQATSFAEDYRVPERRIRVVGQGPNAPIPDRVPARPSAARRVLFVGKAFARKGGAELLAAWPSVRARLPDAELVLVGPQDPGPLPDGVRCEGRIVRAQPGGEERLAALFADATVLVAPSRFEPFGTALLEGMGWGLACVGSAACAMPEVIVDGVTGHLAAPGRPDALADALVAVLRDPRAAVAMGAAGRRRLEAQFTWDRVADRIAAALSEGRW